MKNQTAQGTIVEILSEIRPNNYSMDANLFGAHNNLMPREAAYLLIEMEKRMGINIEELVKTVDTMPDGFTVAALASAAEEQMRGI